MSRRAIVTNFLGDLEMSGGTFPESADCRQRCRGARHMVLTNEWHVQQHPAKWAASFESFDQLLIVRLINLLGRLQCGAEVIAQTVQRDLLALEPKPLLLLEQGRQFRESL